MLGAADGMSPDDTTAGFVLWMRGRRPSARRYSTMAVLHLVCPALVRARVRVRVRARARVRVRVSAPP